MEGVRAAGSDVMREKRAGGDEEGWTRYTGRASWRDGSEAYV